MPDARTRVDKLMTMATQDDSPEEATVAQAKLATMGMWPPPPPPPTAVGGPFAEPDDSNPLGYSWVYRMGDDMVAVHARRVRFDGNPYPGATVTVTVSGPFGDEP